MGKSHFIVRTKNVRKKWLVLIYQIDQESQFIKSFEISEGNTYYHRSVPVFTLKTAPQTWVEFCV